MKGIDNSNTFSRLYDGAGMSHRIYGPLQLHSCKTNNRSTWLNCPALKYGISPPGSNLAKQTRIFLQIFQERKLPKKFPSYVVISRGWHLLPVERQILAYLKQIRAHIFRKAGISRITASYLKASHPKSHLKQRVFDRQPPSLSSYGSQFPSMTNCF